MSGSKQLTLRVQSADGTSRLDVLDTDVTARLFERVYEALHLNTFAFTLHKDRAKKDEIVSSKSRQLREYGIQHGDMLFLSPVNGAVLFDQPSTSAEVQSKQSNEAGPSSASADTNTSKSKIQVVEDDVDLELYKADGNIQRQRDDKLCRHNSKGCCVHCSPLEPWDENYLKEHNIKHMSFHSYIRKITSGKFISLEEPSFKIKPGCTEHPPWPRGICSGCQPGAVTLTRQAFRLTDNVLLEHRAVVDRFLGYWRATGHQRVGVLYGRYERHPAVPLGVRARVAAVYEPPQEGARDAVRLLDDSTRPLLDRIAARLGLRAVGWMFTDLLPLDLAAGTVRHLRGADTHFLSAQECITAAHFQNEHPSACRHASSGYYGSKWVTVCVSGDREHQIHLEGYQVSVQGAALVRDDVLLPTRDAPDLAYIRDCGPQQYVPDVYYKKRDEYGNEVNASAKRLPVAYLLVDVPCGEAPAHRPPTFSSRSAFPPAHRPLASQLQSLRALHQHIEETTDFLEAMSDLHVLLYLATNEALPLDEETLAPLLDAVRERDVAAAERWRREPQPATLLQLAAASAAGGAGGGADGAGGAGGGAQWTCPLCTYHNHAAHDACDMCAMPRHSA